MNQPSDTQETRRKALKQLILDLHAGADMEDVKQRFRELVRDVTPAEVSALEHQLIAEGMPVEEVQRLCDVHVSLFRESLDRQAGPGPEPGHPLFTMRVENRALADAVRELTGAAGALEGQASPDAVAEALGRARNALAFLSSLVEQHYVFKENELFPALERHGVTGPPKVMWGRHDQVRALLKQTTAALRDADVRAAQQNFGPLTTAVSDMIYQEEKILFPLLMETLSPEDWGKVGKAGGPPYGAQQAPSRAASQAPSEAHEAPSHAAPSSAIAPAPGAGGALQLDVGALTPEEVNLILTHLPFDLTFVDDTDAVRYFSKTKERLFPRSPGIIGRKVQNCHPPSSVHIVEKAIAALRDGTRDVAEFWFSSGGKFVHIRYLAVRDAAGRYRGVLEVSQDAAHVRALEGEQRLLQW